MLGLQGAKYNANAAIAPPKPINMKKKVIQLPTFRQQYQHRECLLLCPGRYFFGSMHWNKGKCLMLWRLPHPFQPQHNSWQQQCLGIPLSLEQQGIAEFLFFLPLRFEVDRSLFFLFFLAFRRFFTGSSFIRVWFPSHATPPWLCPWAMSLWECTGSE